MGGGRGMEGRGGGMEGRGEVRGDGGGGGVLVSWSMGE